MTVAAQREEQRAEFVCQLVAEVTEYLALCCAGRQQ